MTCVEVLEKMKTMNSLVVEIMDTGNKIVTPKNSDEKCGKDKQMSEAIEKFNEVDSEIKEWINEQFISCINRNGFYYDREEHISCEEHKKQVISLFESNRLKLANHMIFSNRGNSSEAIYIGVANITGVNKKMITYIKPLDGTDKLVVCNYLIT